MKRPGFTLIEVLVSAGIIAAMLGVLLPALAGARLGAHAAACLSNQRQLVAAWSLYALHHRDRAVPLGDAATGTFWWGRVRYSSIPAGSPAVDPLLGFLAPYLDSALAARSVYECPSQPWGSYRAQPTALAQAGPTSTYGYNGYYLTPSMTPGWSGSIGRQPWKRLADIHRPTELFVFADAMLPGSPVMNTALLDPPMLFEPSGAAGGTWSPNLSPTTSFRHGRSTQSARADGSVRSVGARPGWMTHPDLRIGSCGIENGPHYVPDWRSWR